VTSDRVLPQEFTREPIVLASGSTSRRAVLEAAGIDIVVDKSDVDEDVLKRRFKQAGSGISETALGLALAKAEQVQARHPGQIVLGADQMLDCGGVWFDKPVDRAAASRQLIALSGQTHRLVSAIVALRNGVTLWQTVEIAELTMRPLSADFIDTYLDAVGDRALSSVGAYQVEGLGIQLFTRIQGDHFTILGLPLIPLLDFLRRERVLAS
jgi:septum formation protein